MGDDHRKEQLKIKKQENGKGTTEKLPSLSHITGISPQSEDVMAT